MTVVPNNHTKWKHTWKLHNRGSVWDKIASEWRTGASKEKVSEGSGHARLRELCDDECRTLGRTHAENWRLCENKKSNKQKIRRYKVWIQVDQWTFRDGTKVSDENLTEF